jgi:site-specific recombinase XerD
MDLPKVAVLLNWRNEPNKSGVYSVYLRITIKYISKYIRIALPQKVAPHDWTGKENAWVKQTHPFAFEINNKIREKVNTVQDLIKKYYNGNKNLSFETISQHLKKKGDGKSFYDYMEGYIRNPPEALELNTIKKYRTCLVHLQSFKKELYFTDIDNHLIRAFYKHMQVKLHLEGATCKKYMEAFKKVIRSARRDEYIDAAQMEFLFEDVKIKVGKAKRTFLEVSELKALRNLQFGSKEQHLERDRDLFLLQVYTGYYYKDLQIFQWSQLIKDEEHGYFIVGARDKNGNQTIIPLFKFPHAHSVIQKYASPEPAGYVFAKHHFIEEPVYNRNLKELARLAKISKSISNKTARHTNAQLWIRFGAERTVLSKMMGHTKEETTKNYYDVNIPEIVEGTRRADFEKMGF